MNKIPQIVKRRIGAVDILDLQGQFVGPWALRGREEISQYLKGRQTKNLLVNLRGLTTVDSLGVKAVSENLTDEMRSALVVGNLSVMEMFLRLISPERLRFFKTEYEVIDYFGEDLVKWQEPSFEEKRKHQRLKTALPLEFSCVSEKDEPVCFHGVITDLSEGGLMVEYLDLDQGFFGKARLNPYDFRILNMKVKLPGGPEVFAKGKVVRTVMEGAQFGMGIEFCEISDEDKALFAEYIR